MTVRARLRPIGELPEWAICCDSIRQLHEAQQGEELKAILGTEYVAEVECRFCHRITSGVKYINATSASQFGTAIAVECYEFDEGVNPS
jgi:hypothetical protein